MNIIAFFIVLIPLILQLLIINYLFTLEKNGCTCAMDYKRTYILSYLVVNMFVVLLSMFTDIFKNGSSTIGSFLLNIYGIAGIVNIVFVIKYVNMLKYKQCGCSESVYRDILYVFSIIDAFVLGMAVLLVFYFIFFNSNNKMLKKKVAGNKGTKKLRRYR